MLTSPLADAKHARRCLPHLIAAAEHLRAVDQLARELMPCEHLPILPPTGDSPASIDDLNVAADQLESALAYTAGCTCRADASRQLVAAYKVIVKLWGQVYSEAAFRAKYCKRGARRTLPAHVERLRRHRAAFEQLAFTHRVAVIEAEAVADALIQLFTAA